jgi:cobalt-zinc-cadmium efflux system membrane fusion protein
MLIEGLQIGEIKALFLKAKANLNYAEANYNRLKSLIEQNVGSQKSFLEAKAEFEKAKAELNAEDKKIHSIGLTDKDIEETSENENHIAGLLAVKSPIEGTVVERNVVIGQLVESNTNSFRIINISSLYADGQIYENDLHRISGKPEITLTASAYAGTQFKGKIIYISDIVDKETRTFKIRASVTNKDKKLKPEMFAEMQIPTSISAKALIVPAEAIVKDANENYVFIAINDTTFKKREVIPGSTQGEFVEIKSGVSKGERIVSKGAFILKSEMKKESLEAGD